MKRLLRYDLQTFADENTEGANGSAETETPPEESGKPEENGAKDGAKVQELLVEVAKLKKANDKLAKENGDLNKKYRATLSEQEQASIEKAEAEAERNAEFENMKKQLYINELTENYLDLGYSKDLAKKAATAQAENDTDALLTIQKQFNESQKKAWEEEFYKNKPELRSGNGGGKVISKEEFDSMSLMERTKLKRENEAEYNRLIAL